MYTTSFHFLSIKGWNISKEASKDKGSVTKVCGLDALHKSSFFSFYQIYIYDVNN